MRTLVHTALDPALHMLTPHNVRFRDKFHAVDEGKKPVKESFSTPEYAPPPAIASNHVSNIRHACELQAIVERRYRH